MKSTGILFIICSGLFWVNSPAKIYSCDTVPELNKQVIAFVKSTLGKKIGKGECWDLAAQALNTVHAQWDKNYIFGKEINVASECIYPGDIIQFEGVELEYEKKGVFYKEDLAHHTAIIYEVKDKQSFVLAEQNTDNYGRKVGLNSFELKNIRKGKYKIFRPVK
jgi:hypothetical protein